MTCCMKSYLALLAIWATTALTAANNSPRNNVVVSPPNTKKYTAFITQTRFPTNTYSNYFARTFYSTDTRERQRKQRFEFQPARGTESLSNTQLFAAKGSVGNDTASTKRKIRKKKSVSFTKKKQKKKQSSATTKKKATNTLASVVPPPTVKSTKTEKGNIKNKNGTSTNLAKTKKSRTIKQSSAKQTQIINTKKQKQQPFEDASSNLHIQFSRVFQRHVVYRSHKNNNGLTTTTTTTTDEVLQSFEFLDDALKLYPTANAVLAPRDLPLPPPSCSVVFPDDDENYDNDGKNNNNNNMAKKREVEEEECETTIAGMGLSSLCELEYNNNNNNSNNNNHMLGYEYEEAHAALQTLLRLVSPPSNSRGSLFMVPRHFFRLDPRRFALRGHTPETITRNHARVVELLSCGCSSSRNTNGGGSAAAPSVGLAMDQSDVLFVMSNFPQICLYDGDELESLIRFLMAPLPMEQLSSLANNGVGGDYKFLLGVDWTRLAWEGYGAGLPIDQATKAIRMMPELLALYYEDSRKPSIVYMYNNMQAPMLTKIVDEANTRLMQFLEGTDPSDAYVFAYLRSVGISWKQIAILISALPLWTTNSLDPGWELLQRGPVRSMLKRTSLDYLRQRLQVRPGEVYNMLKVHTRLSGYNECSNIRPTLDSLQRRLRLSSAELRKIVLRMPSLLGMKTLSTYAGEKSSFDDRLEFFVNEAGMSNQELKESVLKQPSLLQYSVASSLRPKVRFFLDELGILPDFIKRIIHSAPALMGLSLTDNLRPKVKTIMTLCSLNGHEVGTIVATSPQTLLLSQKNIETTLSFLFSELMLSDSRELGDIMLSAPRILLRGLETSLATKINMLVESLCEDNSFLSLLSSKEIAADILKANPRLLVLTVKVFDDRIQRCIAKNENLSEGLKPSNKGRQKLVQQSSQTTSLTNNFQNIAIFLSPDAAFYSISRIFPNSESAACDLGVSEADILNACMNLSSIDGNYLLSMDTTINKVPEKTHSTNSTIQENIKTPVSIFVSGGVYPSDNLGSGRGQIRTGGLAIQLVIDESSGNRRQILEQFSVAAKSSFGIRVPLGNDDDGSKLLAVFPFVNPSRNRCELFACYGALRLMESFFKAQRNRKALFDVTVYTDSNYSWKLVRNKERLLMLGSCCSSEEMLRQLDMKKSYVNIDVLHPLARSFSRLNGQPDPVDSAHQEVDNVNVEFLHSMDGTSEIGMQSCVKNLNHLARAAAMWQFNRERSLAR